MRGRVSIKRVGSLERMENDMEMTVECFFCHTKFYRCECGLFHGFDKLKDGTYICNDCGSKRCNKCGKPVSGKDVCTS